MIRKMPGALAKAEAKGIKNKWIDPKAYSDKDVYEQALLDEVGECDLIVLAGINADIGRGFYRESSVSDYEYSSCAFAGFPRSARAEQAVDTG